MAKTIGILGGMGPQASCELYRLINTLTCREFNAASNADFVHLILNSIPVPDLIADTKAKETAVEMVRNGAQALVNAGCTDLLMACNTMHLLSDQIGGGLQVDFHSLIDLVALEVKRVQPKRVLILSTLTTLRTGLYQTAFDRLKIPYAVPSAYLAERSVEMILKTISNQITQLDRDLLAKEILAEISGTEIDSIVLACTELPLVFPNGIDGMRTISSLSVAAHKVCDLHFSNLRERMAA